MKIGIIGAPGSGKTELAKELEKLTGLPVVDGYVERLASRTNLALGFAADFIPNYDVAFERFNLEREVDKEVPGHITCGTAVDSICYAAMWAADIVRLYSDTGEEQFQRGRSNLVMDFFSIFLTETWSYDIVLYKPLPQSDKGELVNRLDHSIRDALAMLGIDHIPLTDEDPIQQATDIVKERLEHNTESTENSE